MGNRFSPTYTAHVYFGPDGRSEWTFQNPFFPGFGVIASGFDAVGDVDGDGHDDLFLNADILSLLARECCRHAKNLKRIA
ncbi:MAG: hypothetical protein ACREQ8_18710, partial [Woeseiaceae bacterium]